MYVWIKRRSSQQAIQGKHSGHLKVCIHIYLHLPRSSDLMRVWLEFKSRLYCSWSCMWLCIGRTKLTEECWRGFFWYSNRDGGRTPAFQMHFCHNTIWISRSPGCWIHRQFVGLTANLFYWKISDLFVSTICTWTWISEDPWAQTWNSLLHRLV